jgi:Tol biopolymer transport system component
VRPGQLNGPVNNADVHPTADRIAFEYNEQIWEMNLDGSGLRKRVEADKIVRFPSYSPDGKAIVFLATRSDDFFTRALFFVNLETNELFELDLARALGSSTSVVPRGPLCWASTSVR